MRVWLAFGNACVCPSRLDNAGTPYLVSISGVTFMVLVAKRITRQESKQPTATTSKHSEEGLTSPSPRKTSKPAQLTSTPSKTVTNPSKNNSAASPSGSAR